MRHLHIDFDDTATETFLYHEVAIETEIEDAMLQRALEQSIEERDEQGPDISCFFCRDSSSAINTCADIINYLKRTVLEKKRDPFTGVPF